jgi:hypothetical protein
VAAAGFFGVVRCFSRFIDVDGDGHVDGQKPDKTGIDKRIPSEIIGKIQSKYIMVDTPCCGI